MDNSDFIKRARETIKLRLSVDDLIAKLVNLIDEGEKAENSLFKAAYDAYFLYYPEAAAIISERDRFVETLSGGLERDVVCGRLGTTGESMGYDMSAEDAQILSVYLNELKNMSDMRTFAERHLDKTVADNYPNLAIFNVNMVIPRLITLGGGVKGLAFMPSSKVQILGAERTLFSRPGRREASPKYGVLFKHPLVEGAPQDKRGKIAKILAAKINLAAKIETFSENDQSAAIKKQLEDEVRAVMDK